MAGLLGKLFGSNQPDPDPNPGIGGYWPPRGPYGEGGYPGSTAATRLNPAEAAGKLHDAPARPQRYYGSRVSRPRTPTIPAQQANVIPAPAQNGSLPYQGPDAKTNPDRVRDTEHRPHIVISQNIPGGQRQRNTVYQGGIKAIPGQPHTYRSAPKGDGFPITEVTVPNRYVYGGVNGGTDALDDMMTARRMPYTGHGAENHMTDPVTGVPLHARGSVRGAALNGDRLFLAPALQVSGLKQGGAYGKKSRGTQRHRPTIYAEPAPKNAQFYDTTASVGTPDRPGTARQVRPAVHFSPQAQRRGWRRG